MFSHGGGLVVAAILQINCQISNKAEELTGLRGVHPGHSSSLFS